MSTRAVGRKDSTRRVEGSDPSFLRSPHTAMSLHSHSRSPPASRAAQQQAKIAAFKLECAQLENDLS